MTPNEFVTWFRGFSQACHHLNPTPQQWQKVLDTLNTVVDDDPARGDGCKTYVYPYKEQVSQDKKQLLND